MPVLIMVRRLIAAPRCGCAIRASGRAIYAIGGNAEAARLCGVSPRAHDGDGVRASMACSPASRRCCSRPSSSVIQSTVPPNLELTVITASVVGGVSILGGVGTVIGSTLAAVLIAEIAQRAGLHQRLALLDARRAGRR